MGWHDDPLVNCYVEILFMDDFSLRGKNPFLGLKPLTFGETLAMLIRKFGREAALHVQISVH